MIREPILGGEGIISGSFTVQGAQDLSLLLRSGVDRGDDAPAANFRARKGVVFATGGFTHDAKLSREHLRGHIWGGCAAPGSTGDFVHIATRAGAVLGKIIVLIFIILFIQWRPRGLFALKGRAAEAYASVEA